MRTVRDVFLNPWVRAVGLLLLVVALGWFLFAIRDILVPFILAFIFAYLFNPVVTWMERHRIRRDLSIFLLLFALAIVVTGAGYLLVRDVREAAEAALEGEVAIEELEDETQEEDAPERTALIQQADEEAQPQQYDDNELSQGERWVQSRIEKALEIIPEEYRPEAEQAAQAVYEWAEPRLQNIAEHTGRIIAQVVGWLIGFAIQISIFIIAAIYLLKDYGKFTAKVKEFMPPRYKDDILRLVREMDFYLWNFFSGQLVVAIILVVLFFISLVIAGIPYAFPVALIGGLANFIPYLGYVLGLLAGTIAALVSFGFDIHLLYVFLIFSIGQTIESAVLTPNIVGNKVGFSPAVVVLALVIFSRFFGFFGILFAVPMAAVVKVLILEANRRYRSHSDVRIVREATAERKDFRAKQDEH